MGRDRREQHAIRFGRIRAMASFMAATRRKSGASSREEVEHYVFRQGYASVFLGLARYCASAPRCLIMAFCNAVFWVDQGGADNSSIVLSCTFLTGSVSFEVGHPRRVQETKP